ncbi:MAG TPA: alpha/beta fold hydrolase [Polyangiaceae bacterium]|nr:alpha/beta fold hydrolase [Polyangiaceae bacterium]
MSSATVETEDPAAGDTPAYHATSAHEPRSLLRSGHGEPLLLLHGVTGSAAMWKRVVPQLSEHHDVIAINALGHRGGVNAALRPVRIAHVVDDAERCLDELGFDQVHLAGNSLGGWVALELARRGRARSVCALSPAGIWEHSDPYASDKLRRIVQRARATRPLMPLLARLPWVRREALRDNARHGERVTVREMLELIDDLLGCTVSDDILATTEQLGPLQAACPITIAWARYDRIFPVDVYGPRARALVPSAHYLVLEGVGHVPMLDDPELVANTILASIARA